MTISILVIFNLWCQILFDFIIYLTQVHNFTVSAQDIYLLSTFGIYRKFYRKCASTNADNETFCTVLMTSQLVIVQSLQPKGLEFESTYVLVFVFCFVVLPFIRFV